MISLLLTAYLAVIEPRHTTIHQCSDSPNVPVLLRSIRTEREIVNVYGVRCTTA